MNEAADCDSVSVIRGEAHEQQWLVLGALKDATPPRVFPSAEELLQIELETISKWGSRILFFLWYFSLFAAVVVTTFATLQWQCTNICGSDNCDLTEFAEWDSRTCVKTSNTTSNVTNRPKRLHERLLPLLLEADNLANTTTNVVWHGGFGDVFDTNLNRFVHYLFAIPRPDHPILHPEWNEWKEDEDIPLHFAIVFYNLTTADAIQDRVDFHMKVSCYVKDQRCSALVLPTSITTIDVASSVSLTVVAPPPRLIAALQNASIAAVYQRGSYTIATIAVRYLLLLVTVLHAWRFIYHQRYCGRMLYEHIWILLIFFGLFLYLNPLFAWGVYDVPQPNLLELLEYRVPYYFVAILISFMFALIVSVMSWSGSAARHYPPYGAQLTSVLFILIIIAVDFLEAANKGWDWGYEHCPNFDCSVVGVLFYGLFAMACLVCVVWMYWLRDHLGQKPYLSSRPQQLAFRLFLLMFATYAVFWVGSVIIIAIRFRHVTSVVTYQLMLQIGPLLVAATFVNIMAFAYTPTLRSPDRVPIHPTDPTWKTVAWPPAWFRWLSLRGGSMYIFFSEAEEVRFMQIQKAPHIHELSFAETTASSASTRTHFRHQTVYADRLSAFQFAQQQIGKIIDTGGSALQFLEDRVADLATAAFRLGLNRKPFFCLESAIDCFNLSWEAYGVPQSEGDAPVMLTIQPQRRIAEMCCCCFLSNDETSDANDSVKGITRDSLNTPLAPGDVSMPTMPSPSGAIAAAAAAPAMPRINVEQYGYRLISTFEGLDVQVIICEMDLGVQRHQDKQPRIVVAFRGTCSLSNAKHDLMIRREPWDAMSASYWLTTSETHACVQHGYLQVWHALEQFVVSTVTKIASEGRGHMIYCTGHSLGGALAVMAAYVLQQKLSRMHYPFPEPTVYTFGMPKIGNRQFANEYRRKVPRTFRVVNESDVVSFINFKDTHVGIEVDIDRHGNFLCEPMFLEKTFRPTKGKGLSLSSHAMQGYADSLNAMTQATGLGICPSRCLVPYVSPEMEERLRSQSTKVFEGSHK